MYAEKISRIFLTFTIIICFSGFSLDQNEPETKSSSTKIQKGTNPLTLETRIDENTKQKTSSGAYQVWENRRTRKGRKITLDFIILHAKSPHPSPDPVFFLAGGPGEKATNLGQVFTNHWIREKRDMVFINQRGTSGDNRLFCNLAGSDDHVQGYLEPLFNPEIFLSCLNDLKKKADLTCYGTADAMDDINEIRQALGYKSINLMGSSYGTRAAFIYLRRHRQSVRCLILNAVAPLELINSFHHPASAQDSLNQLFSQCQSDPACSQAFPDLEKEFNEILFRLQKKPVLVKVTHPKTLKPVSIKLTKSAFAEVVRLMLYRVPFSRTLPYLIHNAYKGQYSPFAEMGIMANRAVRTQISAGMFLCVTCAEDLARVDPAEIPRHTRNTFSGDSRLRNHLKVCKFWPKSPIPESFFDPIRTDIPILLLSGTMDPVTPPAWAEKATKYFPNALHVTAPGSHYVRGSCIDKIQQQFLKTASIKNIDISCVSNISLPPFYIPSRTK
jgi:pimeloyl-ACP methyl ester carboxylesterase